MLDKYSKLEFTVVMLNDDEVIKELEDWLDKNKTNKRKWTTPIGRFIKSTVKSFGNWKETPKWHPPSCNIHDNIKNKDNEIFAEMFEDND
jgi:predicted DNA-binding protein with PD1-like motif